MSMSLAYPASSPPPLKFRTAIEGSLAYYTSQYLGTLLLALAWTQGLDCLPYDNWRFARRSVEKRVPFIIVCGKTPVLLKSTRIRQEEE